MTEETKRILDYLINEKAYLHYGIRREKFIELEGKEVKTLLDYITNLQQENEKLKNFITNLISTLNYCELNLTKKLDIVSDYIKQEYEKLLNGGDTNE